MNQCAWIECGRWFTPRSGHPEQRACSRSCGGHLAAQHSTTRGYVPTTELRALALRALRYRQEPMTEGELATILYGSDDQTARRALRAMVERAARYFARNGVSVEVERVRVYSAVSTAGGREVAS